MDIDINASKTFILSVLANINVNIKTVAKDVCIYTSLSLLLLILRSSIRNSLDILQLDWMLTKMHVAP